MNLNFTVLEDRPALEAAAAPAQTPTPTNVKSERIHAIDWLRVLAFAILMIYHTAEVFTTWKWWIKNDETSVLLSYAMKFFHEWRMFLLFVISGAATHLALGKRSAMKFLNDRVVRILVPLAAGMLLVIPPQIYYIRLNQGEQLSFAAFYADMLESGWFPHGNIHWLHLWYMAFLFVFLLVMMPVISLLKSENGKQLTGRLSLLICRPALLYFPYYAFGALFLVNMAVRRSLVMNRRITLLLAFCTTTAFYLFYWITDTTGMALIPLPVTESAAEGGRLVLKSLNHWFWVLTITGHGLHYLTRGTAFLNYANQAVAPFYILHQTVIVLIAYYTVELSWDIPVKFYMILSVTFCSIFLLYHFVLQRLKLTQILFGIKRPTAQQA